MTSIRDGWTFRGAPISLAALCRLENRDFPCGIAQLTTRGRRRYTGTVASGDVTCKWVMLLQSNGFWDLSADFTDYGEVAGDYYLLEVALTDGHGIGGQLSGRLGTDETAHHKVSGSDRWIWEHWETLTGASATLTVKADVGAIVGSIATVLVVGVVIVFMALNGHTEASRCPDEPDCVQFKQKDPE